MKNIKILIIVAFISQSITAQMKVGTNPKNINSNTYFEVEALNGNRVVVTKDSTKVGIGTLTPNAKLDVMGTIKITDGTQGIGKVLASDSNGLASWKSISTLVASTSDSSTASNGMTLIGKDIQLGGILTKSTLIATNASNTLSLSGLQSGVASDSIMVIDPSTGVLKRIAPISLSQANEPWFNVATNKGATSNTQNIYQMGSIGINTTNPLTALHIAGTSAALSHGILLEENGSINPRKWALCSRSDVPAFIISDETSSKFRFSIRNSDGNVGIGNTSANNKLEITHGVSGNSGLRFTNLTNSNTAVSSSAINQKYLSVNNSGDVVLANSVDQVIGVTGLVSGLISPVSSATFQTGTFENNYSKTDSTVLYVNQIDGTQWVYSASGGGQYKSYVAPATTEWYLANSTNDAGNSKTANIYRKGSVGINTTNPLALLHIAGTSTSWNHGLLLEENGTNNPHKWAISSRSDFPGIAISDETRGVAVMAISNTTGNVGVGTTSPDASSLIEISSISKGFLPSRMTTAQRTSIVSPANGLVLYNTTKKCLELNYGTPSVPVWECLGTVNNTAFNFNCGSGVRTETFISGTPSSSSVSIPINTVTNQGIATFNLGTNSNGITANAYQFNVATSTTSITGFAVNYDGTTPSSTTSFNTVSIPITSANAGGACNLLACIYNKSVADGSSGTRAGISCNQIKTDFPSSTNGIYWVDPDGCNTSYAPMQCQCDMTTDGGGWMLVLNYNHLGGTNPNLLVKTNSFPLLGSTSLGVNESASATTWGHVDNPLLAAIPFTTLRFYGITGNHSRVLHFKTSLGVSYVKTGTGSFSGIQSNFTPLSGHTTFLPASVEFNFSNQGSFAMTEFPYYRSNGNAHWGIKGQGYRWELDDGGTNFNTYHQVWIR